MAKILYIEDDKYVRESTEQVLTKLHGHTVIAQTDTSNADAIAFQWTPDLVITDHNLGPGKETGLELAKRLQANSFKVVVLSGCSMARGEAIKAGVTFFYKPCDIRELLQGMEVDV